MQQLPMAFINIALGGKNPALNQMGKSLSNDDFGQILGSVQDGEDWLQQQLLDRLSPEQMAELQQQLTGGMSLPEAARILLQQQRQAADLPPSPFEQTAEAVSTSVGQGAHPSGLPWPLSQQLPARPPASPDTPPAEAQVTGFPVTKAMAAEPWSESTALDESMRSLAALHTPLDEVMPLPVTGFDSSPTPPLGPLPGEMSSAPASVVDVVTSAAGVPATYAAYTTKPVTGSAAETPTAGPMPTNAPFGAWSTSTAAAQESSVVLPPTVAVGPVEAGTQAQGGVEPSVQTLVRTGVADGIAAAGQIPIPLNTPARIIGEHKLDSTLPAQTPLASILRSLLREQSSTQLGSPTRDPMSIDAPGTTASDSTPRPGPSVILPLESLPPRGAEPPSGLPASRDGQHLITPALMSQMPASTSNADRLAELMGDGLSTIPPITRVAAVPVSEGLAVHGLSASAGSETSTATAARPVGTAMPELAVPQRLNEAGWSQALGERLVLMAGRGQQVAEIKLNPAHLGPLEVKLSLQQDQASVSFLAQHAPVREALEQAIPRLREMFSQQDLQLVNVDVGQRREAPAGGDGSGRRHSGGMAEGGSNREAGPAIEVPISSHTVDPDRRLDLYA